MNQIDTKRTSDTNSLEKMTDLQVTDKLYHISLYRVHLTMSRIPTHNFSNDGHWLYRYKCRYKSNYHTISAKMIFVNQVTYYKPLFELGLRLWCLTPLSTIFQLYCGSQFYWWRKPEKTIDKSHNVVLHKPRLSVIQTLFELD
jgi:hypothetical protein